jgi:hypothetical protein
MVDHKSVIERRQERYYDLIDRACVVLYGPDQMTGGLARDKSPAWADVLWWRYCAGAKWSVVARSTGNSERQAQEYVAEALAWIDRVGYMHEVIELD